MGSENFGTLAGQSRPNDLVEKYRIGPIDYDDRDHAAAGGGDRQRRRVDGGGGGDDGSGGSGGDDVQHRRQFFPNAWPPTTETGGSPQPSSLALGPGPLGSFEARLSSLYRAMEEVAANVAMVFDHAYHALDHQPSEQTPPASPARSAPPAPPEPPGPPGPPAPPAPPLFSSQLVRSSRTSHTSILSCNHYPTIEVGPEAVRTGQLRVAAHTDVSLFTIVVPHESAAMTMHTRGGGEGHMAEGQVGGQTEGQAEGQGLGLGGLEVRLEGSGEWIRVAPRRGCMVLNIGDCMADWTDGRWHSTTHRVSLPRPRPTTSAPGSVPASATGHHRSANEVSVGAAMVRSRMVRPSTLTLTLTFTLTLALIRPHSPSPSPSPSP